MPQPPIIDSTRSRAGAGMKTTAEFISIVTNPKISIFALLLYIAAFRHASVAHTVFLISYALFAVPFLALIRMKASTNDSHEFTDPHHRKARYCTFVLFIGLSIAFFLFALSSEESTLELRYFPTTIAVTTVLLFITWQFHFKLSAHLTFLGIGILYLYPEGVTKYTYFLISGALVGWTRVLLRNHSIFQIVTTAGYVLIVFFVWDQWIFHFTIP